MSADTTYVIDPPPQPALSIAGTDKLFPVRRIWCVGRNYLEHVREMGQDEREPPFFFAKPADAIVHDGATVPYPPLTKDLHHEVELVVALKGHGRNVKAAQALDLVYGYAVGIDLTRRDLQMASRELKRPWEIGKAFDASAPCGALAPASAIGHPKAGRIALTCNGKLRQDGDLSQLIWNVPEIIEKLSEMVALAPGDIIMTGTPAGVGRRRAGRPARLRDRRRRHALGHHRPAGGVNAYSFTSPLGERSASNRVHRDASRVRGHCSVVTPSPGALARSSRGVFKVRHHRPAERLTIIRTSPRQGEVNANDRRPRPRPPHIPR